METTTTQASAARSETPYVASATDRYSRPRTTSFPAWLWLSIVLAVAGVLVQAMHPRLGVDRPVWVVILTLAYTAQLPLLYLWWATLPAGWRRTTPARAIAFCFIPFFNIYWLFMVYYGLAEDLNRYARAHLAGVPRAIPSLVIVFWVSFVAAAAISGITQELGVDAGVVHWISVGSTTACVGVAIAFALCTTRVCTHLLTGPDSVPPATEVPVAMQRIG